MTVLVIAFVVIVFLLAAALFTVAWRRGDTVSAPVERPRRVRRTREAEPAPEVTGDEVPIDPLEARPEIDAADYDVTRRQFFNRGVLGVFGIFLAQFGVAALAFMWPKLRSGGFGSKVNAGKLEDIEKQVFLPDGRIAPLFISAAQAYVLPFQGEMAGSSFDGLPVVAGGYIALWQRCVHLGCRVPECASSQGFECPCHGSKYNYHGEYEDGPAPRNLDRFVVTVNESNELIIDTGQVIQTARSTTKTAEYPQGPSCI
jgi:cytochrome b6-f complex iron-sulfur subunit